ncbi:MAG TPA: hypothetical protein PKA19_05630 [Bacillota bacterium]|nr:hypothetical protein [Bacillota bacterium]
MKKQIMFYILWDVLFFAFLCGFGKISSMLKLYVGRTMNAFPSFFVSLGLLMLLGGIFFLLVTVSSGFQRTAQTAAAEFLLVGLPALYIATAFFIPYLLSQTGVGQVRLHVPPWLYSSSAPMEIGSILFGYELFRLITRIVRK